MYTKLQFFVQKQGSARGGSNSKPKKQDEIYGLFHIDPNQKINLLKVEVEHLQKLSKLLNDAAIQNTGKSNERMIKKLR